jgi:uncharacterized integral membrane protein
MSSEPQGSPAEPTPPGSPEHQSPAEPVKPPASAVSDVGFTRAAALWSALIVGFVILIVLLIFIAQNTDSASFTFLGWHWSLPLGVAILLAAVCGGLITVLASVARIFQLRKAAKKNLKAALKG